LTLRRFAELTHDLNWNEETARTVRDRIREDRGLVLTGVQSGGCRSRRELQVGASELAKKIDVVANRAGAICIAKDACGLDRRHGAKERDGWGIPQHEYKRRYDLGTIGELPQAGYRLGTRGRITVVQPRAPLPSGSAGDGAHVLNRLARVGETSD
jgi:hypothetical protein